MKAVLRYDGRKQSPGAKLSAPTAVEIFTARAEALARLYGQGGLDLHTAVDALQAEAEARGLTKLIGRHAVQAIMAAAFCPWRCSRAPPP
jgi:hypothetical protein